MASPILSSQIWGSQVIRRFGILNDNMPEGDPFYGIPFPGLYLLDGTGHVQAKDFRSNLTTRTTAASLLMQQRGLTPNNGQLEVKTPEVCLTLQLSSRTLRPGQNLLVYAALQVNPGLHLYGPETPDGYFPTTLEISNPDVLAETQFRFPTPQSLRIEALDETVPAYTGTVVISGDLVLKSFIPAGQHFLRGVLRYQACTDSECYPPEELKFEIPLRIEPTVARAEAS